MFLDSVSFNTNKVNVIIKTDESNGRRSLGSAFKRPRYLVETTTRSSKGEKEKSRHKFNSDDEATLRQLLLE